MAQAAVPSKRRQGSGSDAKAIGDWVLGETIFPTASQDPRWGVSVEGNAAPTTNGAESKK